MLRSVHLEINENARSWKRKLLDRMGEEALAHFLFPICRALLIH